MSVVREDLLKSVYRTHTCGELRKHHGGISAKLSGWVHRRRDHGGLIFIDLRDHYGVTQVVLSTDFGLSVEEFDRAQELRSEWVITVEGVVVERDAALVNEKLATGTIELRAVRLFVQSKADALPFNIADEDQAPDMTRLKYRFLELRRDRLHRNTMLRGAVIRKIRELMQGFGFNEFQTPILTSSSPEGARDFIVPSRLHPGKFYALPQAPQQFKQLLMVAGFDRYFQIAPCFRDEDARADRSPGEFYQLDMELSFVEQEDVLSVNEQLLYQLFSSFSSHTVTAPPFPRITYRDAQTRYGSDKPDLRNPLLIDDVSSIFAGTEFKVFREVLSSGGQIHAIAVPVKEVPSRKYFDDTIEWFRGVAGQGLAYLILEESGVKGAIAKFVSPSEQNRLIELYGAKRPTVLFFAAGKGVLPSFGKLRIKLGNDFDLYEKSAFRFCWVTDFPMYEPSEEGTGVQFGHNPFSMPQGGMEALATKAPLDILAYQYDSVCNGYELASGAIRNHSPEIMYRAFEIAGYGPEVVDAKFGGMIRAFQFGAPPHGGIAFGIDRFVMLLANEDAIREVITFPLNQNGEDLLMQAPSVVSEKQLREAHILVRAKPPVT